MLLFGAKAGLRGLRGGEADRDDQWCCVDPLMAYLDSSTLKYYQPMVPCFVMVLEWDDHIRDVNSYPSISTLKDVVVVHGEDEHLNEQREKEKHDREINRGVDWFLKQKDKIRRIIRGLPCRLTA